MNCKDAVVVTVDTAGTVGGLLNNCDSDMQLVPLDLFVGFEEGAEPPLFP